MDPTAANYDAQATVNSNTWCIPVVTGCMMPSPSYLGPAQAAPAGRANLRDGGAANYMLTATVNSVSTCSIYRLGCTSSSARNYDQYATVDDGNCWYNVAGCLNRVALNFNCSYVQYDTDGCSYTDRALVPSIHDEGICRYTYNPPPVASPAFPPGAVVVPVALIEMTMSGDIADYTPTVVDNMKATFAAASAVTIDKVTIVITAGSVVVVVTIEATSTAAANTLQSTLAPLLATPALATTFLTTGTTTPIPSTLAVVSTPIVVASEIATAFSPAPAPPTIGATGANVGAVIGGIIAVLLIVGVIGMLYQRRKAQEKTYPA